MARLSKAATYRCDFIQIMRQAIEKKDSSDLGNIRHHLPFQPPGGGPPAIFIVHLLSNGDGTFLATCREPLGLTVYGNNEEEALALVALAIERVLLRRCGMTK